jgi:ribosomal protein S18 acetylase RimI-like enzyme
MTPSAEHPNHMDIRRLSADDGTEYQVIFLEALRSTPEAFAADYEQEAGRSLDEVAERFQREAIYGGFVQGKLQGIATFQQQMSPKRRHVGMVWNMYLVEQQRGSRLAAALFEHVLNQASKEVDQVDLYVAVSNQRAWRFYKRFGFESYGVMPRALRVAGADYDALMMTRKFR